LVLVVWVGEELGFNKNFHQVRLVLVCHSS
jgi:hypothetical protein